MPRMQFSLVALALALGQGLCLGESVANNLRVAVKQRLAAGTSVANNLRVAAKGDDDVVGAWPQDNNGEWTTDDDGNVILPDGIYSGDNCNGKAQPDVVEGCMCKGTCRARGDPHVTNIWDQTWTETRMSFNLFESSRHGITVAVTAREHYFMETIMFGDTEISAQNCEANGVYLGSEELSTFTYTTDVDLLTVTMTVSCATPTNTGRFGSAFHLDIELTVESNQPMHNVEANGVCIEPHSDDGFDPDLEPPEDIPTQLDCDCTATCHVYGDPHVTSFADETTLLRDHDLTVYDDDKDFKITAVVTDDFYYMHEITVQGRNDNGNIETMTFKVELCDELRMSSGRHTVKIGEFDFPGGDTGRVWGVVECAQEVEGGREGTKYLDVFIASNLEGDAESFLQLEAQSSSSGACTDGNPYA